MRSLFLTLLLLCGSGTFADQQKYGSFILETETPDTLFFVDEIKPGDSFELRKALRNHNIQNVVLASPGGSVFEGLQMAGIIFDRKLRTYIPEGSKCVSACSFLFFAGDERLAEGQLGVHQTYSSNFSEEKAVGQTQYVTQFTVSEIIGFLNEFGTPAFVYERMFQDIDMYYFNENEIKSLNSELFNLTDSERLQLLSTYEQLSKISNEDESKGPAVSEEDGKSPKTEETVETTEVETAKKLLIQKIQKRLKEIGCNPGIIDGVWGKRTESAALAFTKRAGLTINNKEFISNAFLKKITEAPVGFCPKRSKLPQKNKPTNIEVWHGWDYCTVIDGRMPKSVRVEHVDDKTFLITFNNVAATLKTETIRFQSRSGSKSGEYSFKIGSVKFDINIDFDSGTLTGNATETNLALRAVLAAVLVSGRCTINFSRP